MWFRCRNCGIWLGVRSCNESSTFSAKTIVATWSMEVVSDRICLLLWSFRRIHQVKVLRCRRWDDFLYLDNFPYITKNSKFLFDQILSYVACRYLSYVMEVATPTADCLGLVHDLLLPVLMKGSIRGVLSHQEVGVEFSWNSDLMSLHV